VMPWMRVVCAMLVMVGAVGCAAPRTAVRVTGPAGAVMVLSGKEYGLPATVEFERPRRAGESRESPVGFRFPVEGWVMVAEGVLRTYGYEERELDRLSVNTCEIGEREMARLIEGYALILDGYSASKQAIFKMTIGAKR